MNIIDHVITMLHLVHLRTEVVMLWTAAGHYRPSSLLCRLLLLGETIPDQMPIISSPDKMHFSQHGVELVQSLLDTS